MTHCIVCLLRINQKMFDPQLSWPVSRASSRAVTQTTDLVLQVNELQQGDFVFVVASQSSPISGGSSLTEMPGHYGVRAARMPIRPTHHLSLPAKFLTIWVSIAPVGGLSLGHKGKHLDSRDTSTVSFPSMLRFRTLYSEPTWLHIYA
jgi:hypothetical protein